MQKLAPDPPGPQKIVKDRLIDWLFGYDFFISYAHKDGIDYPKSLANQLSAVGYSVFLDKSEFAVGDDLDTETQRRIGMSSYLVILAGPNALRSESVVREIELFKGTGRVPIVVELPCLSPHEIEQYKSFDQDWLRHVETQSVSPSPETISALKHAFTRKRRDVVRRRFLTSSAVILALAIFAGGYYWNGAQQERLRQEIAAAESYVAQAQAALERLEFKRSVLYALATTSVRSDGIITDSQRRILAEASAVYLGARISVGEPNAGMARSVAFSMEEDRIAIGNNNGDIVIAGINGRVQGDVLNLPSTTIDGVPTSASYVNELITVDGGRQFIASDDIGRLHWFAWDDLGHVRSLDAHSDFLSDISLSADGRMIATGGDDNAVRIWDAATGEKLDDFQKVAAVLKNGSRNAITSLAFSPTNGQLAVASKDNSLQILDSTNGNTDASITDFPNEPKLSGGWSHHVRAVEWSPTGVSVSTGSVDGVLRHWDPITAAPSGNSANLDAQRVNMKRLEHFQYLRGGDYIAAAYDSGDLVLFETESGEIVFRFFGTRHWTEDLEVSPSGRYLANASGDGNVWIWDLKPIFETNLIAQICKRLIDYDIDVAVAWSELALEQEVSEIPAPELCTPVHSEREIEPVIEYVPRQN